MLKLYVEDGSREERAETEENFPSLNYDFVPSRILKTANLELSKKDYKIAGIAEKMKLKFAPEVYLCLFSTTTKKLIKETFGCKETFRDERLKIIKFLSKQSSATSGWGCVASVSREAVTRN